MKPRQSLQSGAATFQEPAGAQDAAHRAFDFSKPFFNTETAAAYVDSPNPEAFRAWLRRKGIAVARRGRRILVARVDLDRAIGVGHRKVSA